MAGQGTSPGAGHGAQLHVDRGALIDAAGAFDAVAVTLASNDLDVLDSSLVVSGSSDLDDGLRTFASKWWVGVVVLVNDQRRFARGIRCSVSDFLEVDADVAYALRVLRLGVDRA